MEHILSLSYGKDSLACLGAIEKLGWPLDRIAHAEAWATDTIPADLPPMVEFKARADAVIKERYGITVEHVSASRNGELLTYEKVFYQRFKKGKKIGEIYGFPILKAPWCKSRLKKEILDKAGSKHSVRYLGIAADEPKRIKKHTRPGVMLPLVEIGWDEAYCRKWCEENNLLSPIYTTAARGGCWFCPNQGVGQLRLLRKNYPDLWKLLLKWGKDSPAKFKPEHTVIDYEKRFQAEDDGVIFPYDRVFRWEMLEWPLNYRWF